LLEAGTTLVFHAGRAYREELLPLLEEPHGLAIKDELEDYYEKEIHHGRLYPNLDTLVDKGIVEKAEADRRTNIYSITQRGTRDIDARRDWEDQYVDDLISE
jgi:PadR family transcriptional regulator, regulatory protein PadR